MNPFSNPHLLGLYISSGQFHPNQSLPNKKHSQICGCHRAFGNPKGNLEGTLLAFFPVPVRHRLSQLRTESDHSSSLSGSSPGADTTAEAKALNNQEYDVSFAWKHTLVTVGSFLKGSSFARSFGVGGLYSSSVVFPKPLAAKVVACSFGG